MALHSAESRLIYIGRSRSWQGDTDTGRFCDRVIHRSGEGSDK